MASVRVGESRKYRDGCKLRVVPPALVRPRPRTTGIVQLMEAEQPLGYQGIPLKHREGPAVVDALVAGHLENFMRGLLRARGLDG